MRAGLGDLEDPDPLRALDRALRARTPGAQEVAQTWIAALRQLLGVLRSPTPADRAARAEWDERDWDRWARVERVVLCGGVVAGELGRLAAASDLGADVVLAEDPARAPLHGLAALPGDSLVLDLGHGSIRGAVARGGRLGPTAAHAVPWTPFDTGTWPEPGAVLDLVAASARDAAPGDGGGPLEARVSIANYVVEGRLDDDATYGRLGQLDPDPARLLSECLSAALDRPAHVSVVVNDGAAAALAWDGGPPTAVISIGTSLGLGFTYARG